MRAVTHRLRGEAWGAGREEADGGANTTDGGRLGGVGQEAGREGQGPPESRLPLRLTVQEQRSAPKTQQLV